MTQDDAAFLVRRCVEHVTDVLPRCQKRLGIPRQLIHRLLPRSKFLDPFGQLLVFGFKSPQFRFDGLKPLGSEGLEHFKQFRDVRTGFLLLTLEQFFFLLQLFRGTGQHFQGSFDDLLTSFDLTADRSDAFDHCFFQRLGGNSARLAGIFPTLVILLRARVVVMSAIPAMCRESDHVGSARTPQKPGQKIMPPLRFSGIRPLARRFVQHPLHAFELFFLDDRWMAIVSFGFSPANSTDVDGSPQDAGDLLFLKQVAAAYLVASGFVCRIANAQITQMPCDRPGRTQLLKLIENRTNEVGFLRIDLQLARFVFG